MTDSAAPPERAPLVLLEFGAPGAPPRGAEAARAAVAAHRRHPDAAIVVSIGPLDGDWRRICTDAEFDRFYVTLALALALSPWGAGVVAAFRRGIAALRGLPTGTLPPDRIVFAPEAPAS